MSIDINVKVLRVNCNFSNLETENYIFCPRNMNGKETVLRETRMVGFELREIFVLQICFFFVLPKAVESLGFREKLQSLSTYQKPKNLQLLSRSNRVSLGGPGKFKMTN